ncbi:MAG: serine/threonine-protein kinase, partial [Myxococcota bacterium]
MVEPGHVIGARYRVLEPLGKGGMGTTYAAEDIKTGQQVALKALSLESLSDWKALELFEREARVLKSIDHPGVPAYIDDVSGGEDDAFYLVQERVNGASLAQKMEAGWRPDESEVQRIARGVLDILCYLHGRYPLIIHRDITPSNVLLREDGRVALVDFGAVKDRPQTEDAFASTVVGTYGYMAPEQLQSNAVPASDLYGLGTTLAFVLTGHPPSKLP